MPFTSETNTHRLLRTLFRCHNTQNTNCWSVLKVYSVAGQLLGSDHAVFEQREGDCRSALLAEVDRSILVTDRRLHSRFKYSTISLPQYELGHSYSTLAISIHSTSPFIDWLDSIPFFFHFLLLLPRSLKDCFCCALLLSKAWNMW